MYDRVTRKQTIVLRYLKWYCTQATTSYFIKFFFVK